MVGSAIAVNEVPGRQPLVPRLIQSDAGSYQDATATKIGFIGASISTAQTRGLAGDWLPRVGVGIRIKRLSPPLAGLRGSVPLVLGGMISSYSFTAVECEPNLNEPGNPSWFFCHREQMVVEAANHAFAWVACIKESCTAMVLRVSIPMLKRGSRKGGTLGALFSKPPNTELGAIADSK